MDVNPSPLFEPFNNNTDPPTLKPGVGTSSGYGSIKKKRGRPRKYFLDHDITLSLGSGPMHDATITYPSHSIVKKSTRGRGRPRGSFKKKQEVEVLGVTNTSFSPHLIVVNYGEIMTMEEGRLLYSLFCYEYF
ncbi:AT-hook motif nuclear-localized protein 10-like [Medicago truncatula]|uniref:AT-hook motif nuclear-localized protein 10-like n=1 Tax=Medicago truncatula TaxID=3880 RepID=UPI000D2F3062|nr:AT-hook motif nuclear-localized protein 10-like [Medicago truncatula]